MRHIAHKSLGYDVNCYLNLSTCMDKMELGSFIKTPASPSDLPKDQPHTKLCEYRKHSAFKRVTADVLIMGVKQDKLIPIDEQRDIYLNLLNEGKKNVRFYEIDNIAGHDAVFAERNSP